MVADDGETAVQTMSTTSVIAAICISITLSAAIVVVVVCCRHGAPVDRRRRQRRGRRGWSLRRGGAGYASTAEAVACEMEELDAAAASFDQCSLTTTVDEVRRPQALPVSDDTRPASSSNRPPSPSRTRSTLPPQLLHFV